MTIEQRIREAMQATGSYEPSPDLFAKVQRSIEEDTAHRRRVRNIVIGVVAFVAAIALWLAAWWDPQPGASPLPWWSIAVAAVAVEIAIVIVMGPAIRRFGRIYADDIFRTGPGTGGRFLTLLDVAYYLVFAGFVLVSIPMDPDPSWNLTGGVAAIAQEEGTRIGLLVLLMGLLHAVTIFVLPFAGLVFASSRHRAKVRTRKADWSPDVRRAYRVVTFVIVVVGAVVVTQVASLLLSLLVGVLDGS
jgi:hypothetical protein